MGNCCSKNAQRKATDLDTLPRTTNRGVDKFERLNLSSTKFISDYKKINQKSKDIVYGYIYNEQCSLFTQKNDPYFRIQPNIYYLTLKYYYIEEKNDLNHVEISDLRAFILEKVNNKTMDRLWKHISDESQRITSNDILSTLQFTAVLFIAYRYRVCIDGDCMYSLYFV